jgi:L-ribulokinase
MVAATLAGITDVKKVKRSICAMGHKWLWNRKLGGLPSEQFLTKVDPVLAGVREKLEGEYATSDQIAGHLSPQWAEQLGLKAGIPIPVGAFDAHWDAIARDAALMTWSMLSVHPHASLVLHPRSTLCLVSAVWWKAAYTRCVRELKLDSPLSATYLTPSPRARARLSKH